MEEIGLFPLDMVLLPTELVPLHIFEPRYRELIDECLELELEFGLVQADDTGMRRIGTRAAVVEVLERFEDGRLNIVVEGRERFRIVEMTGGRSFHTAQVEPFADSETESPAEARARAHALFARLRELTSSQVEVTGEETAGLAFALAARLELPVGLKQELLELEGEAPRLERVTTAIDAVVQALVRGQELASRARRNGHAPASGE
ncbi:MAG: LON peptidase substrate-binding domain-containing protein [Gaiella sp.]